MRLSVRTREGTDRPLTACLKPHRPSSSMSTSKPELIKTTAAPCTALQPQPSAPGLPTVLFTPLEAECKTFYLRRNQSQVIDDVASGKVTPTPPLLVLVCADRCTGRPHRNLAQRASGRNLGSGLTRMLARWVRPYLQ